MTLKELLTITATSGAGEDPMVMVGIIADVVDIVLLGLGMTIETNLSAPPGQPPIKIVDVEGVDITGGDDAEI